MSRVRLPYIYKLSAHILPRNPLMGRNLLRLLLLLYATSTLAADLATPWRFNTEEQRPFWLSTTMYGESILFVKDTDARTYASLLLTPTRILSVRSASGETTYSAGLDYLWKPGTRQISLPPGSRIICETAQGLRRPAGSQRHRLTHRDGEGEILFGATHEYHDLQTVVSYQFQPDQWTGPRAIYAGPQLPRSTEKLSLKESLCIALLGDSISTGCNASAWANAAPFQPPYQDLLVLNLQAVYELDITLKNFAVDGTDTAWGLANIEKVIDADPDLVLLAFGMNDSAGRPAKAYQANVQAMIDAVHKEHAHTEFILIAPMLANPDWSYLEHDLFAQYRDALKQLCQPGIALADMTSLWEELLKHKKDRDFTGNGVNHPNDFGHRLYAQVLSALLIPPSTQEK
jgi:lysophospholipase L1-like esterase